MFRTSRSVSGDFRKRETSSGFPAADERLLFVLGSRVPEFRPGFQERRGERQVRVLVFGYRHGVAGNKVETRSVLGDPFLKPVGVELFDVLGDLRESKVSPVFVGRMARHLATKCGCGSDLEIGQRRPLGVEIVDREIAVRLYDYRSAPCACVQMP